MKSKLLTAQLTILFAFGVTALNAQNNGPGPLAGQTSANGPQGSEPSALADGQLKVTLLLTGTIEAFYIDTGVQHPRILLATSDVDQYEIKLAPRWFLDDTDLDEKIAVWMADGTVVTVLVGQHVESEDLTTYFAITIEEVGVDKVYGLRDEDGHPLWTVSVEDPQAASAAVPEIDSTTVETVSGTVVGIESDVYGDGVLVRLEVRNRETLRVRLCSQRRLLAQDFEIGIGDLITATIGTPVRTRGRERWALELQGGSTGEVRLRTRSGHRVRIRAGTAR